LLSAYRRVSYCARGAGRGGEGGGRKRERAKKFPASHMRAISRGVLASTGVKMRKRPPATIRN
jgi:hypothetical protein